MEGNAKNKKKGCIHKNDGLARSASCAHTSTDIHRMATSSGYDYEVFLSFRGKDTRAGFTNFLYTSMIDAGIRVYKDDKELRKGEKLDPELLQAINQSKISMPILSKGYASSIWCLKELVQMVKCQKTQGQKIMPIFYDVAPSEVRHQIGGYREAFFSHENKKRYDQKTLCEWKAALGAVGELGGWDLQSMPSREEGAIAKIITQKVFNDLRKAYLVVSDNLVNVDHQVDKIMEMIDAQTSETRIIGIYGMGGIGKTTIAKIIYNQLSKNFEHCCFLSNIRETSKLKGIQCLQHQLISDILNMKWLDIRNTDEGIKTIKDRLSNKRVLLLLDDVEEKDHMDALVGNRDWFGKGSKLIITTRKKDVLILDVDCTYEVNAMDDLRSLQLFSKHAFRRDSPLNEYLTQSCRAIGIAGGLPLALEVIGSLLSSKSKIMWDDTLNMLESVPHDKVQSKLKISYDALNDRQKHIFLDIACLFIGYDKDILIHFWDESKFPEVALEVLQNMSLIKIKKDNKVWMHDQLRDLGREIVRQECKMKIEEQGRVWNPTEALDLLRRHKGKTNVEALCLHFDHEQQYCFTCKDFKRISNLRFLQVDGSKEHFCAEERLLWHESPSNVLPINVFQENSDLLPQLRWLSWPKIPPTFKITNFSMEDVVILDLSRSEITHDWEGWSHMKVMKNLKVMNLTSCCCLERTPNFSAHSNLERLILQGCHKLVKLDRSIYQLKRLVSLDVRECRSLSWLPDTLNDHLFPDELSESLLLDELDESLLPDELDEDFLLDEPDVDLASHCLTLKYGILLKRLRNSIGNLESLIELDISETAIKKLPNCIGKLKNLKVVKMSGSSIRKIPDALWTIEKLEVIEARIFHDFDVEIGDSIYKNQSLRILRLMNARIFVVPRLPESLIILELFELYIKTFPDLSNLTNLKELKLDFCPHYYDGKSDWPVEEYPMPRWIGNLSKLESLDLTSGYVSTLPTDIRSLLPQLQSLRLWCRNLRRLPSLPSSLLSFSLYSEYVTTLPTDITLLPRLQRLDIHCRNLCCPPSLPSSLLSLCLDPCKSIYLLDLSNLKKLSNLRITDGAISEIQGLDCLESLQTLHLRNLQQVEILPDLSNSNRLSLVEVIDFHNLVEIQGKPPPFLEELEISRCGSLEKLPNLSSLSGLLKVNIENCAKLNVEAISSLCSEKAVEFVED